MREDLDLSAEEMTKRLNEWYVHMRAQDLLQAEKAKQDIDLQLEYIKESKDLFLYYTLLDFRFSVMKQEWSQSKLLLSKVDPLREKLSHLLTYYYHFFQGLYLSRIGQYLDALEQYLTAEKLLADIPDPVERAEFHYRMADLYLDMGKNLSSIQHIRQAQELFRQKTNHAVRCADCENIMGINCVELKQYEEAENHLIRALDIAQKNNDDELVMHVRSNLGFLYSEQRLSEVAIRHLTFVYRHRFNLYKTTFLLAREYFRIGENDQAYRLVEEGLAECRRLNHVEFIHRHLILKAFHSNVQMEELEATVKDGIEHFASRKLWHLVQEYTEKLANTFHQRGEYKKASYYYNIGCEAREKLFVEEALK